MSISDLKKKKSNKILGVDASTNSIAFCLMENKKVIYYGEINFKGKDIYERILDAKRKVAGIANLHLFDVDYMAIEAAVMVKSANTGIKLAYVFGAIMGEMLSDHIKVVEVHPITWQSFIGNKNFTKQQKIDVKKQYPDKGDNWISAKIREIRKQKTNDFAKKHGVVADSDNVSDAFGIAWYATHQILGEA